MDSLEDLKKQADERWEKELNRRLRYLPLSLFCEGDRLYVYYMHQFHLVGRIPKVIEKDLESIREAWKKGHKR